MIAYTFLDWFTFGCAVLCVSYIFTLALAIAKAASRKTPKCDDSCFEQPINGDNHN